MCDKTFNFLALFVGTPARTRVRARRRGGGQAVRPRLRLRIHFRACGRAGFSHGKSHTVGHGFLLLLVAVLCGLLGMFCRASGVDKRGVAVAFGRGRLWGLSLDYSCVCDRRCRSCSAILIGLPYAVDKRAVLVSLGSARLSYFPLVAVVSRKRLRVRLGVVVTVVAVAKCAVVLH